MMYNSYRFNEGEVMKYSEFRRWLLKQGVKLEPHSQEAATSKQPLAISKPAFQTTAVKKSVRG